MRRATTGIFTAVLSENRRCALKLGDQSVNEIWLSVGVSLTNWEQVELYAASLFEYFVECKTKAAARVYGSIMSAAGRSTSIRAAADVFFPRYHVSDADQKSLNLLLQHFGRASRRRDDIAHGMALGITVDGTNFGAFLVPPDYNSSLTHAQMQETKQPDTWDTWSLFRHRYRYNSSDMNAISVKFNALRNVIGDYHDLNAKKHPHQ